MQYKGFQPCLLFLFIQQKGRFLAQEVSVLGLVNTWAGGALWQFLLSNILHPCATPAHCQWRRMYMSNIGSARFMTSITCWSHTHAAPNIAWKFEWPIHIPDHRYPNITDWNSYIKSIADFNWVVTHCAKMGISSGILRSAQKVFHESFCRKGKAGFWRICKCGIKSCGQWH